MEDNGGICSLGRGTLQDKHLLFIAMNNFIVFTVFINDMLHLGYHSRLCFIVS